MRGAALFLLVGGHLQAQDFAQWQVAGDTAGAPARCSASAAIRALNVLFRALRDADMNGLTDALAPAFVFSIGPLTATEGFFVTRSTSTLLHYAQRLKQSQQRLELEAIVFNGWRGGQLEFGPIYFRRSGNGSPRMVRGIGKGTYKCERGISVSNIARRDGPDRSRSRLRVFTFP